MEHANEDDFLDIEGPPVESTADVTDVAEQDTDDTPSGQPRDERGRFASREDEESEDEGEGAAVAPASPDGAHPPGEAPGTPDGASASPAPAEGAPAAVAAEPLTLKVGGREVALDLVRGEGGALTIPADQTQLYLDVLRDGLHHRTSFRQELAARDQQRTQEVQAVRTELRDMQLRAERAEKLRDQMDEIITQRVGSPEAAQRFAQNYDYELRLLLADLQGAQQQVGAYQLPEQEPALDPATFVTAVATQAAPFIQELGDLFDAEDISAIAAHLDVAAARYIVEADRDYPEHGVKKGERVVDLDALGSYIQSVAAPKRRATAQQHAHQSRTTEASRAAAQNAASPAGRFTSNPAAPPSAATAAPTSAAPSARPAASASPAASAPPPTIRSGAASPNAAPAPAGPLRSRREWEASLRVGASGSADDDFFDG